MRAFVYFLLFSLFFVADQGLQAQSLPEATRAVLRAQKRAVLSALQDGVLIALPVPRNMYFKEGAILAQMGCGLQEAQLESALAEAEAASLRLQNLQRLSELSSTSPLELQLSETELRAANARAKGFSEYVERCQIIAAYDGSVVRHLANPFESVTQGQPVVEIIGDDPLEVVIIMPQIYVGILRNGLAFQFTPEGSNQSFRGTLGDLPVVIDTGSQTIELVGVLEGVSSGLLPGMSGSVSFLND